ncbi:unnamed protein product [Ilex paraguariensis]|uniref:RING-type domain-containing protein n=1 Tax=Ilex paraguariensis TaxID=185542 RepID=A0ABC8U7K6_9AQUA
MAWHLKQSLTILLNFNSSMDEAHHDHHTLEFSPLFIGLLGVLVEVIMVTTFHCIVVRTNNQEELPSSSSTNSSSNTTASNSTVALMAMCIYRQLECKEETCAVCLSEFNEGDEIGILPKCAHIFHVQCINKWLCSNPNCPLRRAGIVPWPQNDVAVSLPDSGGVPPPELYEVPHFGG